MRAGKLDRRITLQRKTDLVSASGAVASTWVNLQTVSAELVQFSAEEIRTTFGEAYTNAALFRVRYLAGLTNGDRIAYDGKIYDLKQIVEIGRKRGLELHCELVQ